MHLPSEVSQNRAIGTPLFEHLESIDDLAELLATSSKQLRFLLYARPEHLRYTQFSISKRRGTTRTIKAPREDLKSLQRRFADFLQDRLTFRTPVHGFVRGRSIATNAMVHIQHRAVLNVDLKDFFPSINFGRVRGLFLAQPFRASTAIATVLAQICCHEGYLPQGAPTSPIISNLICLRLDSQLQRLARKYKCIYTRYADDLTFSKRKGSFPPELAQKDESDTIVLGVELRNVIENNGFQIHADKIHLCRNTHRQTVTGLTVNSRVNVSRKFIREIRAMIHDWRCRGLEAAQKRHHEHFYKRNRKAKVRPQLKRIIEGKLNFLKMVRGPDDSLRRTLQKQLVHVWPEYQTAMERENASLDTRDLFISHAFEDKSFVRPLVGALIRAGITVWYDEYQLTIGDDVLLKINEGLTKSRYGVVVLSHSFFHVKKTWTQREVSALFALEDADKRSRVLPIHHGIELSEVAARNPILASRLAWRSTEFSPEELADKFNEFLKARSHDIKGLGR